MIRPASTADLATLFNMVGQMHGESEFMARGIQLSPALVRSFLATGVQRHGGQHAGATLLNVVERGGEIEGFMLGLLQPIYSVCIPLEAVDFWLYCTKKAPKIAPGLLIDRYIAWAESSPKVKDILLSWTNVVGVDGEKIGRLYRRKGFVKRGEMFVRGVAHD